MSSGLVRAVAIGPGGIGDEQRYASNRARFTETGTPWVRLWADWVQVQPRSDAPPDLSALDGDIAQARADGLKVMLTAWRFPRWVNGTAAVDDPSYQLQDRAAAGGDRTRRKDATFKLPADLTPGSAWGRWIESLIVRYAGRIDALEILNEPNLQLWPQQAPSSDPANPYGLGSLTVDAAVATMMQTAAAIAARHAGSPLLVAPATADPAGDSRLRTGFDTFTRALLARLAERGFAPGARFAWSHHNYTDVEGDLVGPFNRVGQMRAMLAGRWAGWPSGDPAAPGILITESGARLTVLARQYGLTDMEAIRLKQAEAVERGLQRMLLGPEGAGVAMVCQYLFVTDINYDCGLCDLDGAPRPAFGAWGSFPSGS